MVYYFSKLGLIKYFVFLILSFVISAVLTVPVITLTGGFSSALLIFITSVALYVSILLLIWYISLTPSDRQLILKPAPARSQGNLLFAFAPFLWSLPINVIYVLFLERFFPDFFDKMLEATNLPQNFLNSSDPLSLILLFLAVVVFAPIVEEIAFRGVLYNLLNKRISLFPAALISSVVFGLLHGATFFQTAAIGLVLAFIYQVTGDLRMSMLGHAVNNGLAFLQGILIENRVIVSGEPSEIVFTSLLLAGGVGMIIISLVYLKNNPLRSIYKDRAPMYKHEIARQYNYESTELPNSF